MFLVFRRIFGYTTGSNVRIREGKHWVLPEQKEDMMIPTSRRIFVWTRSDIVPHNVMMLMTFLKIFPISGAINMRVEHQGDDPMTILAVTPPSCSTQPLIGRQPQ